MAMTEQKFTQSAYKRTYVEREEARLLELETMRDELLALIDRKGEGR